MIPGRPGNPDNDGDWFTGDWMDTTRAQEVLSFQQHSHSDMLAEIRARMGWTAYPLRAMAPMFGAVARRKGPYHMAPGCYADPWGRIRDRWGDPNHD